MMPRSLHAVVLAPLTALLLACGGGGDDAAVDGGTTGADAASDAAPDGDAGTPAPVFTRYPADRVRSPVTASVVERMRAIRALDDARADDVFLKAGASGTVSTNLLFCLAGPEHQPQYRVDLDGRDALEASLAVFRAGRIGETTPFDRVTLAAEVGRTAGWVLDGDPSPLAQEIAAANPRFAFVNYGTNDMGAAGTYAGALALFWERMQVLLDLLEGAGIVPIISGLNPRADDDGAARWVPTFDAATRALAEARQLPFLSLHVASRDLPDMGLLSDGLHGNVLREDGAAQPCVFDAAGLQFNYDVRNLESLTLLDAARRTAVDGAAAPDAPPLAALAGAGTHDDPWIVEDAAAFTHTADTTGGDALLAGYPDCDAGQDEAGPERVYRLTLDAPAALRVVVLDRPDVDVDVHLLDGAGGVACVERDDRVIERTLPAGTHRLVIDTYVSGGTPLAGAYTLIVIACEPDDPACA